ncbi:CinA family nicotinamide mononucleotide deamidase-related protein [Riemerella columbina]|uniref:CinA family nicotinamide mononucleotide deamidase-related protein n=1 Tax=Riemerella columbina TaxID=103810 RepID=UPI00266FE7DA|nr:CinA family nicotinamide mononucleotide deamidase-related protein [Riemerella columbina]WKS94825.1 CinA family nicotinamide mononucleotide deamidase-related protein [Riemerella columbina]
MKTAVLITIGDEILSGNTIDTNSNFIAQELKNIGIEVVRILTISDDHQQINQALDEAFRSAPLVISTGGLGPTKDDKTKTAVAHYFSDHLAIDPSTLAHLKQYLTRRNRADLFEINQAQATVPSRAKIFQNDYGTAPCFLMENAQKLLFVLPGVPYEVKPLIKEKILPYLKERYQQPYLLSRVVSVVDFPESLLSQTIEKWEMALPQHIKLSYLPIGNRVKLKLSISGDDQALLERQLDTAIEQLKPLIADKVIGWAEDDLVSILKHLLIQKQLKISCAESCTGGAIAKLLTSISGSSAYFEGGIVTYATAQKVKILQVPQDLIDRETVVSEQVATAMSQGCRKLFGTDISIATTGVAGPKTDAYQNRIGEVYYTISIGTSVYPYHLYLPHLERNDFIDFVAQRCLQSLVEVLVKAQNSTQNQK